MGKQVYLSNVDVLLEEERKQAEKQDGLQGDNTNVDSLNRMSSVKDNPLDCLVNASSDFESTRTPYLAEGNRSQKKRKRKKDKRYLEERKNQHDAFQGNDINVDSFNRISSVKDAPIDPLVGASSDFESRKTQFLAEGKKSQKKIKIKKEKEDFEENKKQDEKLDGLQESDTNVNSFTGMSSEKDAPLEPLVKATSSVESTKIQLGEQKKSQKKRRRKKNKRHEDMGSNKTDCEGSDGLPSMKITSLQGDASVGQNMMSSVTDGSLDVLVKATSGIEEAQFLGEQKKSRKKRKRNRKGKRKKMDSNEGLDGVSCTETKDMDGNRTECEGPNGVSSMKSTTSEGCTSIGSSDKTLMDAELTPQCKTKRRKKPNRKKKTCHGSDKDHDVPEDVTKSKVESVSSHMKQNIEEEGMEGETKVDRECSSSLSVEKGDIDLTVTKENNVSQFTVTKENNVSQLSHSSVDSVSVGSSKKKLLVLDINGILAHVTPYFHLAYKPDKTISKKAVFKRPYCDDFLSFCFERFSVGIWSSRTKRNVDMMVDFLMGESRQKLLFCWDQSHCTETGLKTMENRNKPLVLKELRKLWEKLEPDLPWEKGEYNETNTLLMDDSPYKALRNPPNTAIFPQSYHFKDRQDKALAPGGKLRKYLGRLAEADNVQKFVEQNPFGQPAITEANESWNFYCQVISGGSPQPRDDDNEPVAPAVVS